MSKVSSGGYAEPFIFDIICGCVIFGKVAPAGTWLRVSLRRVADGNIFLTRSGAISIPNQKNGRNEDERYDKDAFTLCRMSRESFIVHIFCFSHSSKIVARRPCKERNELVSRIFKEIFK